MTKPISNSEDIVPASEEASLLEWETPEAVSLSVSHTYNGGTMGGAPDGTYTYT